MTFMRWILFLPAGVITGALVQFLYPAFIAGRDAVNGILMLIAAPIAGAVTIYVSAKIAPIDNKMKVAIPLCFASVINLGVAICYQIELHDTLITLFQVLGSIYMTVQIYRREILFND